MSKVLIGMPTMHEVVTPFFSSMLMMKYDGNQYAYDIKSNSLVYMARNWIAADAVNNNFDWLLFLDSDMVVGSDTLSRMVEVAEVNGLDVLSGIYFKKAIPTAPILLKTLKWDVRDGVAEVDTEVYGDYPRDSLFEVAGCGMGCTLISVKTLLDLGAAFRRGPFDPLPALGEDYAFCWRVGELGKKVWCDSRIKVGHVGQYVYDEKDYLRQEGKTC